MIRRQDLVTPGNQGAQRAQLAGQQIQNVALLRHREMSKGEISAKDQVEPAGGRCVSDILQQKLDPSAHLGTQADVVVILDDSSGSQARGHVAQEALTVGTMPVGMTTASLTLNRNWLASTNGSFSRTRLRASAIAASLSSSGSSTAIPLIT
ncbi:MAG: hypothetical protein OEU92_34950 [Alphaproteobacteria bacterium]|nr:hypothetical protein [Alphaproteobacteria bacterium]